MANPLTGDFEAVLQVKGRILNCLLAVMHQNAGSDDGRPSAPHRLFIRLGDDAQGGPISGVRGTVWTQVSTPMVELIAGSQDQFIIICWLRARYRPDIDTTPLPEFIKGELRVTCKIEVVINENFENYLHVSLLSETVSFKPAAKTSADAQITEQLAAYVATRFQPMDRLMPEGVDSLRVIELVSGAKSAVAMPLSLSGAGIGGDVGTIKEIVLGDREMAVAISRQYIEGLIQPALDALKASQRTFDITGTLGFSPVIYSETATYTVTINTATAQWLSGVVRLSVTGKATTPKWWAPNATFSVNQDLELKFDGSSNTFSINPVGEPDVKVDVNGPLGGLVEPMAKEKARSIFIQERDKALAQVQPTLQGALAQKQRLVDLLRLVDDGANASFSEAEFSQEGIVLRGWITTSQLKPMHVSFEELPDQSGYTAFETWVPGGRVDTYRWNWYWIKPGDIKMFGFQDVEKHERTYSNRFVLTDVTGVPGLPGEGPENHADTTENHGDTTANPDNKTFNHGDILEMDVTSNTIGGFVVVNAGPPKIGLQTFGQLCLYVTGAQINASGDLVHVDKIVGFYSGRDCDYDVAPPDWLRPLEAIDIMPKKTWSLRLSPIGRPPFLMDENEWISVEFGSGGGPPDPRGRPNSLVGFVDHRTLLPTLESLGEAIQQAGRDDAGILLTLVMPEGSLKHIDRETAGRLNLLQRTLGDTMALITEDIRGSLSGTYGVSRITDGVVATYLLNPRGEVAFRSEHLPETARMVEILREHLEESITPRPRLLRLKSRASERAPDFLFDAAPGRSMALRRLRGRSVLLAFVRADSNPSLAVLRQLERFQERLERKQTTVIAVVDEVRPEEMGRLRQEHDLHLILYADPRGKIARRYGVSAWPTTILIDADGRIVRTHMGADPGALVALARERRDRAAERYRDEARSL